MFTRPLFFATISTLVALAVLHHMAMLDFWYWKYLWLDTGMHFLGGVAIGFLLLFVVVEWFRLVPRGSQALYASLALGFGISVVWEVFEYHVGIPKERNYQFDTSLDLLMDMLGIIFANLIARRFF